MNEEYLLSLHDVSVHYGPVAAVRSVNIRAAANSIVTIIGANGAGKTTLLRTISGLLQPSAGRIVFAEHSIEAIPAESIVGLGIAQVPEGRRVFPDLTVDENLRLGAYLRRDKEAIKRDLIDIYERLPRLRERTRQRAKTMSGGEQQMLAIGRALMSAPRLLLLDEPSMGLSPVMTEEIADIIKEVRTLRRMAIVLVEQNAEMALQMSDYGYVLETGRVVLEGAATELHDNEHVRRAYLGG